MIRSKVNYKAKHPTSVRTEKAEKIKEIIKPQQSDEDKKVSAEKKDSGERKSVKHNESEITHANEDTSGDLKYILDNWDGILNDIKKIRVSFHAVVKEAEPTELKNNTLKLAFQPNYKFHYQTANKKENLDFFKAFINKKLNSSYDIEFFFNDGKKKVENEEESEDIFQKAESFFGQKVEKIKD
jgi:hypothetical protein